MHVHHPAFGVPSPTVPEIRARCEADARRLWDAAVSLARWRVAQEEALAAVPYGGPDPEAGAVEPGDLARAIVALQPELLGSTLMGAPLDRAHAIWRQRIAEASDLPLAYSWGRRWAIREAAGASVDPGVLLRSLPDRTLWALSALDPRNAEGLITAREAYCALFDQLGARGHVGLTVQPAWLEREPDAVWRERLVHGPGFALVGEACSGRRALIRQLRRLLLQTRGMNVDNWHGGGSPDPRYRARPDAVPASIAPGLVCAWTRVPEDPPLLRYAAEMALDPDAAFQLILAATEAGWARLCEMAPDLARWPVVPMPPPTDDELLPIWLCQRPYIEDVLGERIDLRRLLPLPPDRLRRLLAAVDPHDLTIPEQGHAVRLREALGELLCARSRATRRQIREHPELAALDAGFSGDDSR
ncbi:hypothetical protein OV079_36155 [Nannocystis pusilla]|uniref:Uncharacterized protein n=1 Tax=Nannocystis pusilla TaxID=889268 RepID=A0A9X3EV64_9BACT|nr:hypothetical protein [Nannocystis pusilla]MCY1010907.1 hypothetical protein [Nannocystis pusilla]